MNMKKLNNKNKSGFTHAPLSLTKSGAGFTLIEIIIGLSLGVLVITTMTSIGVLSLKHLRTIEHTQSLHSNAIFLLNTITYWAKQGKNLSLTAPSTLQVELPNSSLKEIAKNGDRIEINGAAFTPDNIEVTALSFTKMAHSVQVDLTLKVKGTEETFSAKTTIAQRNISQ